MATVRAPDIRDYDPASTLEWIETDGVGGIASSSVLGVNTRKQHGLLALLNPFKGRTILVANIQETLLDGPHSYDLSTHAFDGAVHPTGYASLERFTDEPWPTWHYRFGGLAFEKQVACVHGEHMVVVSYAVRGTDRPVTLIVRPFLAFRAHNNLLLESEDFGGSWQVSDEYVECRPLPNGPALFIAHPAAEVRTVGLWYRRFLYARDRESHVECIEDLYHPGYLEMLLPPDEPRALIFSTPSPRPAAAAENYLAAERTRRQAVVRVEGAGPDVFFERLLRSADAFVHKTPKGRVGIFPGIPWGDCDMYRGLLAFAGLLLVPRRFDEAREYLVGIADVWRRRESPTGLAPEVVMGQMHPADVPLWIFVAAWRFWRATGDNDFAREVLAPLLEEIAHYYQAGIEVRITAENLVEVGHESGAGYAPHLPLGTNALWYNAQRVLEEIVPLRHPAKARSWRKRAQQTFDSFQPVFACERRAGVADSVTRTPRGRDETIRASQVLAVGLPFAVLANPLPVMDLIERHLATPFGPRTLSAQDSRYVGDGRDVKILPTYWSGSVDPTWFGCYCDGLRLVGQSSAGRQLFAPFEVEIGRRGLGHISGGFAGDAPHEPCDYVASASGLAEVLRIYARDVMGLEHVT